MADVSISDLNLGVPAGNDVVPYSTSSGSATNKTLVSSITAGVPVYVAKQLFSGTTAERPSPATAGAIRFNTSTNKAEIYNGTNWGSILSDFGPYTLEVLIVAGGGGGGGTSGGGGGGGVIPFFNFTANSFTSYTATVGAGGAGGQNNGANSVFNSTYTAIGGGGGAEYLGNGSVGGSGGGGGQTGSPGAGTAGQGNAGGSGKSGGYPYAGGCGGGYSSAGGNFSGGGVGGTGYALDVNVKQVAPFVNLNGAVVTHVGSGGGYNSTSGAGAGGPGAGGSAGAAKWYGCGGCAGGAGFKGAIVIRYAGTQRGAGGDYITYNAADNKTYHVFTTVGTATFSSN